MIKHIGFAGDGLSLYTVDGIFIEKVISGLKNGIKSIEESQQGNKYKVNDNPELFENYESSIQFLSEIEKAKNR